MLFLVTFLTVGIVVGLSIRKIAELAKTSEKVLIILYYTCLFLITLFLRFDEKITSVIDKIGWHSFINVIIAFSVIIILTWSVIRLSKLMIQTKKN